MWNSGTVNLWEPGNRCPSHSHFWRPFFQTTTKKIPLGIHSNSCLSESISTAACLSAAQGWLEHSLPQLALLAQSRGYACYNKCCLYMYIKTFLSLSRKQRKGWSSNSPHHHTAAKQWTSWASWWDQKANSIPALNLIWEVVLITGKK